MKIKNEVLAFRTQYLSDPEYEQYCIKTCTAENLYFLQDCFKLLNPDYTYFRTDISSQELTDIYIKYIQSGGQYAVNISQRQNREDFKTLMTSIDADLFEELVKHISFIGHIQEQKLDEADFQRFKTEREVAQNSASTPATAEKSCCCTLF